MICQGGRYHFLHGHHIYINPRFEQEINTFRLPASLQSLSHHRIRNMRVGTTGILARHVSSILVFRRLPRACISLRAGDQPAYDSHSKTIHRRYRLNSDQPGCICRVVVSRHIESCCIVKRRDFDSRRRLRHPELSVCVQHPGAHAPTPKVQCRNARQLPRPNVAACRNQIGEKGQKRALAQGKRTEDARTLQCRVAAAGPSRSRYPFNPPESSMSKRASNTRNVLSLVFKDLPVQVVRTSSADLWSRCPRCRMSRPVLSCHKQSSM